MTRAGGGPEDSPGLLFDREEVVFTVLRSWCMKQDASEADRHGSKGESGVGWREGGSESAIQWWLPPTLSSGVVSAREERNTDSFSRLGFFSIPEKVMKFMWEQQQTSSGTAQDRTAQDRAGQGKRDG